MTFGEAKKTFLDIHESFNDYWEMQFAWIVFTDGLCKDKTITQRQFENWGNPCTLEGFKRFNKRFKMIN